MLDSKLLPIGWARATLGDMMLFVTSGSRGWAQHYASSGATFIRVGNLNRRCIDLDLEDVQFVEPPNNAEAARTTVFPGDILISITADVGMVAVAPETIGEAYVNQHIALCRPLPGSFARYLAYALIDPNGTQKQFVDIQYGVTKASLSLGQIKDASLPLPPLNEQRRIVAKIEALFARTKKAREALEAIPPLLEKFRQSVLAAAFRGDLTAEWRAQHPDVEPASVLLEKIRQERRRKWEEDLRAKGKDPAKATYKEPEPVDESELPELPDGWSWAALDELRAPSGPIVYGIIQPGEDVADGVPYVRPADINAAGEIDISQLKRSSVEIARQYQRSVLRTGDIILSIVGTIGKVIITPTELNGSNITQSSVRIRPPDGMDPQFLSLILMAPVLTKQYDLLRFGNAVQRLNVEHVRRLVVPFPPFSEQEAIVLACNQALARAQAVAGAVKDATGQVSRLEQSILAKAFRGELVPQDPNDEPASVLLERIRVEREAASPAKRSRGRSASSDDGAASDQVKKRGRPRKAAEAEADNELREEGLDDIARQLAEVEQQRELLEAALRAKS